MATRRARTSFVCKLSERLLEPKRRVVCAAGRVGGATSKVVRPGASSVVPLPPSAWDSAVVLVRPCLSVGDAANHSASGQRCRSIQGPCGRPTVPRVRVGTCKKPSPRAQCCVCAAVDLPEPRCGARWRPPSSSTASPWLPPSACQVRTISGSGPAWSGIGRAAQRRLRWRRDVARDEPRRSCFARFSGRGRRTRGYLAARVGTWDSDGIEADGGLDKHTASNGRRDRLAHGSVPRSVLPAIFTDRRQRRDWVLTLARHSGMPCQQTVHY